MRHHAFLILLLAALAGCSAEEPAERGAEETGAPGESATEAASTSGGPDRPADPLTDTVWVRQGEDGPPGELRIFLSDGTLVQDSCVEVYALRTWRRTSPQEIVLVEDVEIPARIVSLGKDELRLSLALVDGTRQEITYRRAQPPFVCPEMPR